MRDAAADILPPAVDTPHQNRTDSITPRSYGKDRIKPMKKTIIIFFVLTVIFNTQTVFSRESRPWIMGINFENAPEQYDFKFMADLPTSPYAGIPGFYYEDRYVRESDGMWLLDCYWGQDEEFYGDDYVGTYYDTIIIGSKHWEGDEDSGGKKNAEDAFEKLTVLLNEQYGPETDEPTGSIGSDHRKYIKEWKVNEEWSCSLSYEYEERDKNRRFYQTLVTFRNIPIGILDFDKLKDELSAEYLHTLNKTQLRLLRNGVYAQHGRPFKDKILQKFFYNSYYASYKENKNYSDAMLTELDKRNIALIKNEERTR